jgi:hypothetical protein
MFDDKGELSVPVVGFLLIGFIALFSGFAILNARWDFFDTTAASVSAVFITTGLILLITSYFSFKRAFIIEGVVFGMFGLYSAVAGYGGNMTTILGIESVGFLSIILCVFALVLMFMAWRIGDRLIDLLAKLILVAFAPLGFVELDLAIIVSAIGFFLIALVSLYYAVNDWMLVQDIAEDYAEFVYGEEDCGCGCEEHTETAE